MTEALQQNMKKIGMQEIPAVGEEPDGIYHFVLDTTSAKHEEEQDRIVEVVQPGYTLHGEVIRKANVIVAK
jgi:molecular chaperone GrpE (heat shock protein)